MGELKMNGKLNFLVHYESVPTKIILFFVLLGLFCISSGYGFEKMQPLPIPSPFVSNSFLSPVNNSDFCLIQHDRDSVKYYFNWFGKKDGIAVYMDPSKICDTINPYPFKIINVHFYLYDPGSFVFPVEIQVNVRDIHSAPIPCRL